MAELHFLRPAWLLLLPLLLWAAWRFGTGRGGVSAWRNVVERPLQPFVLADGDAPGRRRWPLFAAVALAVLASLALAGPAWDRQPVPAYRSDDALVVALDLSRSMDAEDVAPSRLARAKLKLIDLLERRASGQTALVVFSANAFTVTPLTNDTKTIAALIGSLGTDIMPSQGSLLDVGLQKSAALLRQAAVRDGEILLITDAAPLPADFDLAAALAREGIAIHVLAVGTEDGAPIPSPGGGFVTDATGQVVVPRVDLSGLQRLAAEGRGRFARLAVSDSDLDRLFPAGGIADASVAADGESREAEVWRDRGVWLAVLLLPLVALGFRRGWVYVLAAAVVLPAPRAEAFEWHDLWQRPDQRGYEAMQRGAPEEAARLFDDPEWRAAAEYRAGRYAQSAAALSGIDSPEAHYNRGNALARAGRLDEAIEAYDSALALQPDHADAAYNKELLRELLEQQQQQQQQQQQSQQGEQSRDEREQQGGEQGAEASPESRAEAAPEEPGSEQQGGAEPRPGEASADSNASRQAGGSERAETEGETEPAEPDADPAPQVAAAPDNLEQWASEQAADQWLRRIPQDPGGLLRRKFLYQYQQLGIDQDDNPTRRPGSVEPW